VREFAVPSDRSSTVPSQPFDSLIPTNELEAERRHLRESRAGLRLMREQVLALKVQAPDPVSAAYLEAQLYYRAAALVDDPATPLFFGRLDMSAPEVAQHYVGRRHVHDGSGEPLVLDWRAAVSRAFYKASAGDPMGVARRRRFGFAEGELTAFEDERFDDPSAPHGRSRILTDEIERPRVGPMRDIVATIQPDQDDLVRADLSQTLCIQGAPGTGKTAVGLHRAAYLLYAFRERLARSGVLVVGPNRTFLGYIGDVLPALGELDVRQLTLAELVGHVPIRGTDDETAARIKGDARMAEVLSRALRSHLREPEQALMLARGSRRYRLPGYRIAELVANLRSRELRYEAARALLPRSIAAAICTQIEADGTATDDRTESAIARTREVRAYVDQVWPKVDAATLVGRLLTDPALLGGAAEGLLTTAEQQALLTDLPGRGPRGLRWSMADAVLIDEAMDLLERTKGFGHVILDEAQDLSPMQYRAVGRRCALSSATVLGDLAQGTTPWATEGWDTALDHLGKPAGLVQELTAGYRVPRQIIEFASRLLPHVAPGLAAATSVRQAAGALELRSGGGSAREFGTELVATCRAALDQPGSVGVICADSRAGAIAKALRSGELEPEIAGSDGLTARLSVVPATLAKGLEFDHVIVVEPAEIVASESRGLRRLYVVLTRAVTTLTVLHSQPLPAELAA
jgi:DNA helicase IV